MLSRLDLLFGLVRNLVAPALVVGLLACGTNNPLTPFDSDAGSPTHAEGAPLGPNVRALIEIHALDLWAQPLPTSARLQVRRDGVLVPTEGWPVAAFPVEDAATYEVALSAEGHETLQFAIRFDGTTTLEAMRLRRYASGERSGLVTSHDLRTVSGRSLPVHAIFTGLRHRWFSAHGRPARRGNRVRLLTNGEESWGQVAEDLLHAVDRVHVATWWWTSDFELVRDRDAHVTSRREEREANTILGMLDDIFPTKRVLVGHLLGQDGRLSWLTTDGDLRSRGAAPNDDFEFMGQANPTAGASRGRSSPSRSPSACSTAGRCRGSAASAPTSPSPRRCPATSSTSPAGPFARASNTRATTRSSWSSTVASRSSAE